MARAPIPAPPALQLVDAPQWVRFMPGRESIPEYCDYVRDLCVAWSRNQWGNELLQNRLSILHYIVNGLPNEAPWISVKQQGSDLMIENAVGEMIPNVYRYYDRDLGRYTIPPLLTAFDPESRGKLQGTQEWGKGNDIAKRNLEEGRKRKTDTLAAPLAGRGENQGYKKPRPNNGNNHENGGNEDKIHPITGLPRVHFCKLCPRNHPGQDCAGNKVACKLCGAWGHRSYECRKKHQGNRGNTNPSNTRSGAPVKRVHLCKKCPRNHPGTDCQGNRVTCKACGKVGHRNYECRVKHPNKERE